jgi:hypothetical protein
LSDAIGDAKGQSDSLAALHSGQADLLLLNDTFVGKEWEALYVHVFRMEIHPTQHPIGSDLASIVDVDFREHMAQLALTTDAVIAILHPDVPVPDSHDVSDVEKAAR